MQLESMGMPRPSATEKETSTWHWLWQQEGVSLSGARFPMCRGRALATWHQMPFCREASWCLVQVRGARDAAGFHPVS